ncbi:radial spoke head 10 homolog B isoform X1 [Denticeps clupeoides]|nr:radial spoke head 10 homolog B-like isoform X1 [Denticeps clupeoides]
MAGAEQQSAALLGLLVGRYDGESIRGLFHGEGAATFRGAHEFKGQFAQGLLHGRGSCRWPDGVTYQGDFRSNVLLGDGTYAWPDGSTYEGQVSGGLRHGFGTFTCGQTSVVYRGQWHRGTRHGKGTLYYRQELSSWYDGDLVENEREGWGLRCYPSGSVYEGQWRAGVRHGGGTMRWPRLGQQYSGSWENGVQQGYGTHTWYLRQSPGSRHPRTNKYSGQFVQGLRHGHGTFYYAGGAVYQGGWRLNKKHGQGTFVSQNGRIFEAEFVDDRMVACGTPGEGGIQQGTGSALLGPEMSLSIPTLLGQFAEGRREVELQQVELAVLRHVAEIRSIYSFYSSLGHRDDTVLLSRVQLWRLLKDCHIHLRGLSLTQVNRLCSDEHAHAPFTTMLLSQVMNCLVTLAYHIYHTGAESSGHKLATCFTMLMKSDIIPNAKNVQGSLFGDPERAVISMSYASRCWAIYEDICRTTSHNTMTMRQFIWMLKDINLLDGELTVVQVLDVLSVDNPAVYSCTCSNLDMEMSFLEFFEALLCCAELKGQQKADRVTDSVCDLQGVETKEAPAEQSSPHLSTGNGSSKSLEVKKSRAFLHSSAPPFHLRPNKTDLDSVALTMSAVHIFSSLQPQKYEELRSPSAIDIQETDFSRSVLLAEPSTGEHWSRSIHRFLHQTFFTAYERGRELRQEAGADTVLQTAGPNQQWKKEAVAQRRTSDEHDSTALITSTSPGSHNGSKLGKKEQQ